MARTADAAWTTPENERRIAAEIARQGPRLRGFIRSRVANAEDVEDILQDVLGELVEAYRGLQPIERVGAWLVRVAANRITDLFRRKKAVPLEDLRGAAFEHGGDESVEDLLPSPDAGPEAAYARTVLLEELVAALEELPAAQREAFLAHEIEGRSFRDLAAQTGVNESTLLARKRYAVLHLRERLRDVHEEFFGAGGTQE
ncbi:MAG TPA: sigma-70 family RNA polymerase sigma factor [Usitatibacter sp.]|nr:sigma-70 family RNA polymerase sigma factor [Usitatibacter sp.]